MEGVEEQVKDSLLRIIDDLETKQQEAIELSLSLSQDADINYWYGYHDSLAYAIKELKKALEDNS